MSLRNTALHRWLFTLPLVAFLAACTAQDSWNAVEYDAHRAGRMFSVGYKDVSDVYINNVGVSDLAKAGMASMVSIEPGFAVTYENNQTIVSLDGRAVGSFATPAAQDADSWGSLTAAVIEVGRKESELLRAAEKENLYEAVFDGVLGELDNFSRYAGREEARENRASRDGFGGIGVRIRLVDNGVHVVSVMENTPAEEAGLADNDLIVKINDEDTIGLTQRGVVRRLRGPLRSRVRLTIERETDANALLVEVVRSHIVPQTVKYLRVENFAHIRVSGFNQSTTRTLREKIKQAKREIGSNLAGIILDLRGNPGGLLDQSVSISDLFVRKGRIVSTHGRHPDSHQYFNADRDDMAEDLPVAVLVNGSSASASEIVAAALQDAGRAVVIGSNSFGKGTVQTVLRLPNEGELTLTWARFHAPSGYALHRRGVLPDICTSGDVATADDVLARLRDGRLPIGRSLQTSEIDTDDDSAVEALRALCPARNGDADIDMDVAKRLLGDPDLFARALGGGAPDTAGQAPAQVSGLAIRQGLIVLDRSDLRRE